MLRKIGFLLALSCAALFSGCSLLAPQLDQAADAAGKLVTFYCENVTSPEMRQQFREAVNAKAAPHSVNVTCANGAPSLQTSKEDSSHDQAEKVSSTGTSPGAAPEKQARRPIEIPQAFAGAAERGTRVHFGGAGECAPLDSRSSERGAAEACSGRAGAESGRGAGSESGRL